jgi:hypothetical protein
VSSGWLPLAVVITCSLAPRIDQSTRSLCVAESWVANSVLADSVHDMFLLPALVADHASSVPAP